MWLCECVVVGGLGWVVGEEEMGLTTGTDPQVAVKGCDDHGACKMVVVVVVDGGSWWVGCAGCLSVACVWDGNDGMWMRGCDDLKK